MSDAIVTATLCASSAWTRRVCAKPGRVHGSRTDARTRISDCSFAEGVPEISGQHAHDVFDDMFAGDEQATRRSRTCVPIGTRWVSQHHEYRFSPRVVKDLPDDALTDDEKAARDAGKWVRGYDIRRSIKYEHTWVGIPSNIGATVQRDLEKIGIKAGDRTVCRLRRGSSSVLKGAKLDTFPKCSDW